MLYKIKINCTDKNNLSFNNKKINENIYNEIKNKLNPNNDNFIDKIIILYKYPNKYSYFCVKSLEIICNIKLTEDQFIKYIKKMKNCGFYSINDYIIEFIDLTSYNTIYKYKFDSMISENIEPRNNTYKNNSVYYTYTIY